MLPRLHGEIQEAVGRGRQLLSLDLRLFSLSDATSVIYTAKKRSWSRSWGWADSFAQMPPTNKIKPFWLCQLLLGPVSDFKICLCVLEGFFFVLSLPTNLAFSIVWRQTFQSPKSCGIRWRGKTNSTWHKWTSGSQRSRALFHYISW